MSLASKTCVKCNVSKSTKDFERGRDDCKACRYAMKCMFHSNTDENTLQIPKECVKCKKSTGVEFSYRKDTGKYRPECKACMRVLGQGYSAKSRAKKIEKDANAYRAHNAEMARTRRAKNGEKNAPYANVPSEAHD